MKNFSRNLLFNETVGSKSLEVKHIDLFWQLQYGLNFSKCSFLSTPNWNFFCNYLKRRIEHTTKFTLSWNIRNSNFLSSVQSYVWIDLEHWEQWYDICFEYTSFLAGKGAWLLKFLRYWYLVLETVECDGIRRNPNGHVITLVVTVFTKNVEC